ncbi:MAG: MerR family transcriptional regulator [Pseudomonadota bacterium]
MRISELAKATDVGVETVRYYQRRGLLRTPPRPGAQGTSRGVRVYHEEDARRIRFIKSAQSAGFTLSEIATLLSLDSKENRAKVRALTVVRLEALDRKISELTAARAALGRLLASCDPSESGPCPILLAFEDEGQNTTA